MSNEKKLPPVKANKLKALKVEAATKTQKATKKKPVIKDLSGSAFPFEIETENFSQTLDSVMGINFFEDTKLPKQEEVKNLFEQMPGLFEGIAEKPFTLKYGYDIFEKYDTVFKGQFLDLKESVISDQDGKEFTLVIDNDTRRIAMQQRKKLGITLPELFRNAIWTYLETLTK